jgi:hypothetical protein
VEGPLCGGDAMFIDCPGCPRCLAEGPLTVIVPREEGEAMLAMAASMETAELVGDNGVRVTVDPLAAVIHGGSPPHGPLGFPPTRRQAGRPGGRKCPADCHAHPPAIKTCEPKCREHRNHIYIICYGRPVKVRDRDYLHEDRDAWASGYPITHYVGFTTQRPGLSARG